MPGPKPRGDHALTPAERQAARRARLKAAGVKQGWIRDPAAAGKPPVVVRYRRPADKRSRPKRWQDAVETLATLLERLDDDGWSRTGLYNYPEPALRTVEWIAIHTIHELLHHRGDIR